jgi:tetratricopeptide (TPR) repeat protein
MALKQLCYKVLSVSVSGQFKIPKRGFVLKSVLTSFLVIVSLLLLSGCSTVSPRLGKDQELEAEAATISAKQESKADESPRSAIKADLLYVLLTSEIAGQRGQLDLALDGYMKAMRTTHNSQVAERAAKIAWFAQKQELAIEAINVWLIEDPANIEANRLKVGWFMARADMDGALGQIDILLALSGVDLKQELVTLSQRVGKFPNKEQGLAFMRRIAEKYDDRAEAHYAFSLLAFHKEKLKVSALEIRRARELSPRWIEAMVLESQILAKQGNIIEAAVVIEQALEIEPKNIKLRMLQAQLMLGGGDIKGAEKAFRRIIEESPSNHDALFSLGLLELRRGVQEGAKEKFEKLALDPKWSSQSSFYLGGIALKNKAYIEAVSWFDQVARGRLYLEAQMGAVQALTTKGKFDEVRQRLAELREQFPKDQIRFYLVEGEVLREAGDYQAAFDLYGKAIEFNPDELRLFYARSLVSERLGRLDMVESDLLYVLKVKPDDVNALNALGYTLSNRTERYEEAEEYLQKALVLKPNDAAIMDSYGWLQFKKGQFESALSYLQRAYKKNRDAEIAAHLGEVLWAVGKKAQAKNIWKEADGAHPGSTHLREIKERFKGVF